jgi:predicted transport protein
MIPGQNNIEGFLFTPGKYFLIPEFQRPYSWEAENIKAFLDDIEQLIASSKKHYFGTVVFVSDSKDANASAIIDGQQRVTTSLLMLTALYHIIEKNPDKSELVAEEIREKYLFNSSSYVNQKQRIKLKAVTTDDLIFKKLYEGGIESDQLDARDKQSRLYQAFSIFCEYFKDKNGLERYVRALKSLEIFTLSLDGNDDNPQRVFESINSTGKPLTDGDKIRNFALMLNSHETREYVLEQYWRKIERPLTDANKDFITDFFRSYIISKRQAVIPLGNVYPEFKKLFAKHITPEQHQEDLDAFYGDILQSLEHYRLLKFGDDSKERFQNISRVAFAMRYIQTELYIPFALSVLRHYDKGHLSNDELARVFKLIETYFARRIVCNIPTTSVDKMLASLHTDIVDLQESHPDASYVEIMSYILLSRTGATRFPQDTELDEAIRTNQTYNQRKAHVNFVLACVDDQSKESRLLSQIASGDIKLTIEHIMPQTLTPEWRVELGENFEEIHNQYLHTLANLTLTGYNSEYSNLPFAKKQTIEHGFNDSPLAINKFVRDSEHWNLEALKRRQGWWEAKLHTIWPTPETSFEPPKVSATVSLLDDVNLTHTQIRSIHIAGDTVPVTSWAQALDALVERAFELDENLYGKVEEDEYLSRYIRADDTALITPSPIAETGYYVETGTPTQYKKMLAQKLAKIMGWTRADLMAELDTPPKAEQEEAEKANSEDEWTEDDHLQKLSPELRGTYDTLKQLLFELDPNIQPAAVKSYVRFKNNIWSVTLTFPRDAIKAELPIGDYQDPQHKITHATNGRLFVDLKASEDANYLLSLVREYIAQNGAARQAQ